MNHFDENNSNEDWMGHFAMEEPVHDMMHSIHPSMAQHVSAPAPSVPQNLSPFTPALQQMQPSDCGAASPHLMPVNPQAHLTAFPGVAPRRGSTQGDLIQSRSSSQSRFNPAIAKHSSIPSLNKLTERVAQMEAKLNQRDQGAEYMSSVVSRLDNMSRVTSRLEGDVKVILAWIGFLAKELGLAAPSSGTLLSEPRHGAAQFPVDSGVE